MSTIQIRFFTFRSALLWMAAGVCLTFPGDGQANEPASLRLDRDEAARHALAYNRELRAAALELEQAKARLRWSGKLPAPELDLSASTDRFGLRDGESVLSIAIERRFPLTDRLKREKDLSRVGLALAEMEIAEARRRLIAEVERAHLEALASSEKERLLREMESLAESFVETLARQAEEGAVSRLDVNQATLDRRQIAAELRRQAAETTRLLSELKPQLGLGAEMEIRLRGSIFPLPPQTGETDAESVRLRRPDWRLAVLREDEARAELALAESNRWEDIAVRLFAEREGMVDAPGGLERNTFAGVGISIPLPLKRERLTDEPSAALNQAVERSGAVALRIGNEIEATERNRKELLEAAREAGGEIVTLAEENLAATKEAYEAGQIELFSFQRAREQALAARRAALEAAVDWHRAEIEWRKATATAPGIYPEEAPSAGKP